MRVKNIGAVERYIRLGIALALFSLVFMQPGFGILEGLGVIAAFCLLYNFFYSHCYGWQWLGISTRNSVNSVQLKSANTSPTKVKPNA